MKKLRLGAESDSQGTSGPGSWVLAPNQGSFSQPLRAGLCCLDVLTTLVCLRASAAPPALLASPTDPAVGISEAQAGARAE